MSFHNAKRPYFLADIEPTIAVADAMRWEREAATPLPSPKIRSPELLKQARAMRSAYQRDLLLRFANFLMSLLYAPLASKPPASTKARPRP